MLRASCWGAPPITANKLQDHFDRYMISIHSRHMLNGLASHHRLLSCIRTPSGIESGVCRPHWRAMAVHKAKSGCTEAHHDTPNLPPYLRLVSPGVCTLALHVKPNAKVRLVLWLIDMLRGQHLRWSMKMANATATMLSRLPA